MSVVAEEADEAVGWLEHAQAVKLGDPAQVAELLAEAMELRNVFAASYRTSRRRQSPDR
jgi:hypothetical protein